MKIQHLKLKSSNIEAQKTFYTETLELPITRELENEFTLKIGDSLLTFEQSNELGIYHFAFNIPSFSENEALAWLKQRCQILPFQNQEIVDFEDWNAKAMYFHDADGNILELIARKNLNIGLNEPFSGACILNISEIGAPCLDVANTCNGLNSKYGLTQYSGDNKRFSAIGDEEGLFIVIDHQVKKWIPTMVEALPKSFEIEMGIANHSHSAKFPFKLL